MTLGEDAIIAGLMRLGVPRDKAEREAAAQLRDTRPVTGPAPDPAAVVPAPAPAIAWPVRVTVPWSLLISDNDKHIPKSPMLLTKEYRQAKERIHQLGLDAVAGAAPAAIPLRLTAQVWLPRRGAIDVVNRAKIVHDGLEHAVYANDRWLYEAHWLRAGVDVDAPRAELSIVPLPETRNRP